MIASGGFFFWILAAMGVVSLIVYFGRFFDLRRAQIDYQDFLKGVINILDAGNTAEALAVCEDTPVPVANVIATAIRSRDASASMLRETVNSQGRAEAARLDRRLATLAIVGQISPLVGLLGTVVGFVRCVTMVDSSQIVSRVDLLNSTMESLLVTAAGIALSVVVSVMYGSLRVRLERIVVELEAAASQIIGYLSDRREGGQSR